MSDSTDRAYMRFAEVQKSYDGEELVIKNLNLDIDRGAAAPNKHSTSHEFSSS